MTDLDTAAIRAEAKRVATSANVTWVRLAFDLCDALDAALAADQDRYNEYHERFCLYRSRAEAAEARADVFLANLLDAEARIAKVAEIVRTASVIDPEQAFQDIERVLTEEE